MGFVTNVLGYYHKHETTIWFIAMMGIACFLVFYSIMSSYNVFEESSFNLSFHTVLIIVSVALAIAVSYFMIESFGQERHVQFYDGEEVLLKSTSKTTYAAILSLGDKDVNIAPVKSNVYLTTMGLCVEPKGSGEISIFIPKDMIRDYKPDRNGILVRYMDIKGVYTEVLFIVDNRSAFLEEIGRMTANNFL